MWPLADWSLNSQFKISEGRNGFSILLFSLVSKDEWGQKWGLCLKVWTVRAVRMFICRLWRWVFIWSYTYLGPEITGDWGVGASRVVGEITQVTQAGDHLCEKMKARSQSRRRCNFCALLWSSLGYCSDLPNGSFQVPLKCADPASPF